MVQNTGVTGFLTECSGHKGVVTALLKRHSTVSKLCRTSRKAGIPRNVDHVAESQMREGNPPVSQATALDTTASAPAGQTNDSEKNVVDFTHLLSELGLKPDSLVQEIGVDDDVDDPLRDALEGQLEEPLIDEDEQEVVDAVLLWFRAGDDDLTDALMDSLTTLDEGGVVWLLTPRSGRVGYVAPVEIQDAAPNAGLHVTTSAGVSADWAAARLVGRKS